jgi:hypothetical protein
MTQHPAGWLPAPDRPESLRYWNGSEWTDQYAPGQPAAPTTTAVAPGPAGGKRSALIAVGAVALLAGGCVIGAAVAGGSNDDGGTAAAADTVTATVTSTPPPGPTMTVTETLKPKITKTETVTAPPPPPKAAFKGDGIYLVGVDIEPGTYRNSDGGDCYWARLSGLSGDFNELITNGGSSGQNVVEVKESDKALEVSRCGSWEKIT